MFRVIQAGNRWTWEMIAACGRVLVYTEDRYDTDFEAAEAVKKYRAAFWTMAWPIDHRMGACI
jgi:hypothetical protein